MFVFLSKFLPLWIYPLGFIWLLLVGYLILTLKNRRQKKFRWLVVVVVFLIFILGNRWAPAILTRSLEWRYFPPETLPQNSVVVLLDGGTESQQYPRQIPEPNATGDRIFYTAYLYQQGVAKTILVSGGNIEWQGANTGSPAQGMAYILDVIGIPTDDVIVQDKSRNTAEDARYCARLLKEMSVDEIILVTSASHMPRSVALFEKQGLTVIPAPTDYRITADNWHALWNPSWQDLVIGLVPNASNLSAVNSVLKEYIGYFVYRIQGWL